MPLNLKNKSVLIWDTGLSMEHAVRLGRDFQKVYYFTPYQTQYPKFQDFCIGLGMEGIEKVKHFFDYCDAVDLIVFFDIGMGDLCHFLRQKGYRVFGAGWAEYLENRRFEVRRLQEKIGLPTQQTTRIRGVSRLREYLKKNDNQFVKLDIFRGDIESFFAKDYDSVEMIIDEIESTFGPHKEDYEFIAEQYIPTEIEIGVDGWFCQRFLRPLLIGIEYQKGCYIGKVMDTAPSYLENTLERLTPTLQKLDCRSAVSTEERVISPDKSYLIDLCMRLPFPLSASYTEFITNFSELVWNIAEGNPIDIQYQDTYVGALPLESSHALNHWLKLEFPEDLRKHIKLRTASKVGNNYYATKGNETVFILIAWGNNIQSIVEQFEGLIEEVDAFGLRKEAIGGIHKIAEMKETLNSYGIKWE